MGTLNHPGVASRASRFPLPPGTSLDLHWRSPLATHGSFHKSQELQHGCILLREIHSHHFVFFLG